MLPAVEDCATPFDENCDGLAPACTGALSWAKRFGDASDQHAECIAVDSMGNILVTGYFSGSVDFGGGPLVSAGLADIFVAKLDPSGHEIWSERFGGAFDQNAQGVALDSAGNVFITGSFYGSVDFGGGQLLSAGGSADVFIAKFDGAGTHLWSKGFGDMAPQSASGVTVDVEGNVIITGTFSGSVNFGGSDLLSAGGTDIFVAKFDTLGNPLWSHGFGDFANQYSESIAVDDVGDALIAGTFYGLVDFGGGPLVSAGTADVFVAKFDPQGNHLWSNRFGDASAQAAYAISVDHTGAVLVTGAFNGVTDFGGGPLTSMGGADVFVAKFDAHGAHIYSKGYGDGSDQTAKGIAVDTFGNVLVTGILEGAIDFGGGPLQSAGGDDIFIAKLDPTLKHLWSKRVGDPSDQEAKSVATDGAGNVVLTGYFSGAADFGAGPLTSAGGTDAFVAKFSE